jgi:hypothetical protein
MIGRREVLGGLVLGALQPAVARAQDGEMKMRIRVAFSTLSFTATLEDDNASARELATMLPLEQTISDFGGNEKIAYLPRKLTALVRGPISDPAPGDLCYYVPWGNLAFFHGSYESTRDLVRLGRLDDGGAPLLVRGEFPLRIERI